MTCVESMRVSYVNKIEYKNKGREKTELHDFYRLSFAHFQGLCSMELDEEHEGEKKWEERKREREERRTEKTVKFY